jgi:hypothetical protein
MALIQHKALRGSNLHPIGYVVASGDMLPTASEQADGTGAYMQDTGALCVASGGAWRIAQAQTTGEIHLSVQGMIIPSVDGASALEQVNTSGDTSYIVSKFAKTVGKKYGEWVIPIPSGFGGNTIDAVVRGFADGASGDVAIGVQTAIISASGSTDATYGTAGEAIIPAANGEMVISDAIEGIPVGEYTPGDVMIVRIYRDGANALDMLNAAFCLIGMSIRYKRSAESV